MANITIDRATLARIQKKLGKLADFANEARAPMQESVNLLQRHMATYPSPPPASTYRRTGTLGRKWTSRNYRTAGGRRGEVGNNTEYAPWVQSAAQQAGMHKGRWLTDEKALEKYGPTILKIWEDWAAEILRR